MRRRQLIYEKLTHSVIGAFYEVYNHLGFGFSEDVYMTALERELRVRGHKVQREVWVMIYYKREPIKRQRLDMVVDDKLAVEGKSTYELKKNATFQLYSYLKASDIRVGLFLHLSQSQGSTASSLRSVTINQVNPGGFRRIRSLPRSRA